MSYMRKQDHEIHGYDLYNAFKREPLENDGNYILVVVIPVALLVAFTIVVGADRVFNVMAQFIGGIVTNQ